MQTFTNYPKHSQINDVLDKEYNNGTAWHLGWEDASMKRWNNPFHADVSPGEYLYYNLGFDAYKQYYPDELEDYRNREL